ncbi:hypothetical protein TorRG33x02_079690 [Trema orientale]|uniref:Uncharacterized protein n=1 Tax=Trema orientale TaxID=63057 RepID=A0A2P5FF07_TREOI|nr:hypothetical protein TorRG33x02_079690 [Trema orientale]
MSSTLQYYKQRGESKFPQLYYCLFIIIIFFPVA